MFFTLREMTPSITKSGPHRFVSFSNTDEDVTVMPKIKAKTYFHEKVSTYVIMYVALKTG